MILVKTQYKIYDQKILAIFEVFKIWCNYLENYRYKVHILTNYNNYCQFMEIKSQIFHQVYWAQALSLYYFNSDYYLGKTNALANVFSYFSQKCQAKEKTVLRYKFSNFWLFIDFINQDQLSKT